MTSYKVEDMSCGHCVSAIEGAVREIDPQAKVRADLGTKVVEVESTAGPAAVQAALNAIGYEAEPLTS